ncbi:MAG: O-antigen ligase family protein [Myxococcota bacterium]
MSATPPAPGPGAPTRSLDDLALDGSMLALSFGAALNLSTGQIAIVLVGLALLLRLVRNPHALAPHARTLGPALAAPVAFILLCLLSSVTTPVAWPGSFDATRWRPLVGIPLGALALMVRGPGLAIRCALVFAVGCAVHAGIGLYQVATGEAPLADLLRVPLDKRQVPAPGREDLFSAVGLFYNRVRLSHVLAAGVAVSTGMLLVRSRARVLLVASGLLGFAGLMATFGRAALGALMMTLAGLAVWLALRGDPARRARRLRLAGVGIAVMLLAVAAVPPARARLLTALDVGHNQDRIFLWGRGAEMAMDHAPTGTGFGGYAVVRDAYYDRINDTIQSRTMSHNLLLSLLAETGVLGLMAWLWMWWALFRQVMSTRGTVAISGLLGAATFHAATLAHDPLYQSECALAWGFCAILMCAPPEDSTPRQ